MAHPIKSVRNDEVLNTLRLFGFSIPNTVDMTGAQNSTWKKKILPLLEQQRPGSGQAMFDRAISATKDLKLIPLDAPPRERMIGALKAFGINEQAIKRITEQSKHYGDDRFFTAVANELGNAPETRGILESASQAVGYRDRPELGLVPPPPRGGAPLPGDVRTVEAGQPLGAPVTAPPAPKPAAKAAATPAAKAAPTPTTNLQGQVVEKALGKNATDAEVEAYFRRNYGAEAWMLQIPDFKDIIRGVATNPSGWSLSSITSAVQQKPWWQQNGKNVAEFLQRQANDPVGLQATIKSKGDTIRNKALAFGMSLSDETILNLATEASKWGWDDNLVNQNLSQQWDWQEGQVNVLSSKLQQEAKQYLVPIDEGVIDSWGKRIIAAPEEEQGNWLLFLREQAKSMFPSFAARLDGGENMDQISKPYRDLAAEWLEIDPNDVDFTNPKWIGALDQVDDKGNHSSMSYSDWTRKLMNDPVYRYDYTTNAKEAAAGMATGLLQKFGAISG